MDQQEFHSHIRYLQEQDPPTSVPDVKERLNIIERIVGAMDPNDDYNRALLNVVNQLRESLDVVIQVEDGDDLTGIAGLLENINRNIDDLTRGRIDPTDLPGGLQGEAVTSITQGDQGIGVFQFNGAEYAVPVEGDEDIDQFTRIRVLTRGDNVVQSIPDEEEGSSRPEEVVSIYRKSVNSGDDILDNDIKSGTEADSLRVTVTLDTSAEFRRRVNPPDDSDNEFNATFNAAASTVALSANGSYEFTFDADPDATYNFRVGADLEVLELRVLKLTGD